MRRGILIHHPMRTLLGNDPLTRYQGIVIFANDKEKKANTSMLRVREIWEITEAGKAVVTLLKISGIYQELVQEFEMIEKDKMRKVG